MLRFKRLSMENFGPYKNREVIEFPAEKGVVIIRGRNGRGKTTILNAIRFLLFGQIKQNGKKAVPLNKFVNQIGENNGNYSYTVSLIVDVDGDSYEITRQLTPKRDKVVPNDERDYDQSLSIRSLSKENAVLTPNESKLFLNQIMTEPVSRFYLFDGELLKEYESQLSDEDDSAARQIRDGIERILGVPILKNARDHIHSLFTDQDNQYNNELKANKMTQEIGQVRANAEKKRDELNKDCQDALETLNDIKDELSEKEELFDKSASDRSAILDRDRWKESLSRHNSEKENVEDKLKAKLADAWKGMLLPVLLKNKKIIDSEIKDIENIKSDNERQKQLISDLKKSINESRCKFCNQPLDSSAIEELNKRLSEQMDATTNEDIDENKLYSLKKKSEYISKYIPVEIQYSVKEICDLCDNLAKAKRDISLDKNELIYAEQKVKESSYSEEKLRVLVDQIGILTQKKINTESKLKIAKSNLDELKNKINKCDEQLRKFSKSKNIDLALYKRDYLASLENLFIESINRYQDELRSNVQSDATDLFLKLSSEKEYSGLQIKNNYALDIVFKDNTCIPLRSSGYEHLVAFSLIGALHKNAPMRGPLFMDTSFGRLDRENSENLIRVLPKLSEQVIILVHDQEIDERMLKSHIPEYITASYGIERISARESHLKLEEAY